MAHQLFPGTAFLMAIAVFALSSATMRAEPPWSQPVTLSYPAVNAHSPSVAISDTGAMVATWVRQEGSNYEIQASIHKNGNWGPPTKLSQSGQNAFESCVAIDRNGVATAVWTSGNMILTSSSAPFTGGGWTLPLALSASGISAFAPKAVVDAAGNVTAMWARYDINGVPGIETANRAVGKKWSSPLRIALGAPRDLMLVINDRGDAAAIWDMGSSNASIYVSTRPFLSPWSTGPVWSVPYNVAPAAYRQGGGQIGIAANGNIVASWRSNTDIRVADRTMGGSWSPTRTVYSSRSVSDYPTLAVTPSGDAMVAWVTYVSVGGSYNYQINTTVRPVGGDWSPPALLTSDQEYDRELHAGTSNGGACVLTWLDINSSSLKSSSWKVNKGWYEFATIAPGSDTALAVGGDTALAIWMGGSFQAQVSTLSVSK